MFNRFYRIKLPEYLGFFAGKRFVPSFRVWPIFLPVWCCLSYIYRQSVRLSSTFSRWAAYQNPVVVCGIYGFIERYFGAVGLHHIWNVPFQMQIGEYTNLQRVRYSRRHSALYGGRPDGRYVVWRLHCSKCTVCRLRPLLSGTLLNRKTAQSGRYHDFRHALTSFLTGITEPIEFSFMFVAPILYIDIHAVWRVWRIPVCILRTGDA